MFKAHLKLCVLRQLRQHEQSGYDLLALSITGKKPSAGSMYPLLKELEEGKFVTSHTSGRKTLYKITAKGTKLITALEKQHDDTLKAMVKTIQPIADQDEIEQYLSFRKEMQRYKAQLIDDMDVYERLHKAMFRAYDARSETVHTKLHRILTKAAEQIEQLPVHTK